MTAVAMALLAACGAKGPLFMPEKPAAEEDVPAAPAGDTAPADAGDATGDETGPAQVPPAEPVPPPATP